MATLPGTPTATGHAQSKLVTPDGVVPGAIVYNKTTDTIQVGASTNTFRNISPVVASTTISSGTFSDLLIVIKFTIMFKCNTNDANLYF